MGHFLAVSFAPGETLDRNENPFLGRARRSLQRLTGVSGLRELPGPGSSILMLADDRGDCLAEPEEGGCLYVLGLRPYAQETGEGKSAIQLAGAFRRDGLPALGSLAPPFGACGWNPDSTAIHAVTDGRGLQHIYTWQGPGIAAVSSSALALGHAAQAQLDDEALGVYALVGNYLGPRSPFRGIEKLRHGQACILQDGTQELRPASSASPAGQEPVAHAALVQRGCEDVRHAVAACLRAIPDACLELSGGLDSRLLLAAVPSDVRKSMCAVTLGFAGSADVEIARILASKFGMDHRVVSLEEMTRLEPAEAMRLVREASQACDHCANPFARGVLLWTDRRLGLVPRLTGQNGEYARGFYYPGFSEGDHVSPDRIRSLAKWRITVNESVDGNLMSPTFREAAINGCLAELNSEFGAGSGAWLEATDEFYLQNRMERAVGVAYSATRQYRPLLAPLFHDRFVNWARTVPTPHKRGGRIVAELLATMDPQIARIPLDSGLSPTSLFASSLAGQLQRAIQTGLKTARKVKQRLFGGGRKTVGAQDLLRLAMRDQPALDELVPHVLSRDILTPGVSRQRPDQLSWTTLGYLLNLEWTLAFLADTSD